MSTADSNVIEVPVFICVLLICAMIMIGIGIGALLEQSRARGEAIVHGAAHYDAKTGEWRWNQEKP